MPAEYQDRFLSVREVAKYLGCSSATIWRRTADGTLPQPVKIGAMTRWSQTELFNYVEEAKSGRVAA